MKTLIACLLIALSFVAGNKADNRNLVKRIDHISIYYNSIEEVDSMLSLFNKVLGLPIWFSPEVRNVVSPSTMKFYNSGVYLGNVFLEFITFKVENITNDSASIKPYKHAFAFTNEIPNTGEELDKREIKRSRLFNYSFQETDRSIDTLFTNVVVNDLTSNKLVIFFCQYHPKLFDCSSFDYGDFPKLLNPEDQHPFYKNQLEKRKGGFLTVQKVHKIIVSANNYALYKQKFKTVLSPTVEKQDGLWELNNGPSLLILPGDDQLKLESILIKVRSLTSAKKYLDLKNIGFEEKNDSLKLNISNNIGLDLFLIK